MDTLFWRRIRDRLAMVWYFRWPPSGPSLARCQKLFPAIFCFLCLSGCMPAKAENAGLGDAQCPALRKLVQGYADGFKALRGEREGPRSVVWQARFDAIGRGCEIWTGGEAAHYVCIRSAPNKAVADEYYEKARSTLRDCLGTAWRERELPRRQGAGTKAVFSNPDEKATIVVHEIRNEGLLRDQWTIYYLVGALNGQ